MIFIQIIQESQIKNIRYNLDVVGIKFCILCGKQVNSEKIICGICGGSSFLNGKFAERLGGYILLDKERLIKKYYNKLHRKKSSINMSSRRIIFYLLLGDGFINKSNDIEMREMEGLVYKCVRSN